MTLDEIKKEIEAMGPKVELISVPYGKHDVMWRVILEYSYWKVEVGSKNKYGAFYGFPSAVSAANAAWQWVKERG